MKTTRRGLFTMFVVSPLMKVVPEDEVDGHRYTRSGEAEVWKPINIPVVQDGETKAWMGGYVRVNGGPMLSLDEVNGMKFVHDDVITFHED